MERLAVERLVHANGVQIWCNDLGDPAGPVLLMINGVHAQGVSWPPRLLDRLIEGGLRVVVYDARDTGQSTCFPLSPEPYTMTDMAEDAIGVLDALAIERAHVLGYSMGGYVAQEVALDHPERVETMTLLGAGPTVGTGELPGPTPGLIEKWTKIITEAFSAEMTRERFIEMRVNTNRELVGDDEYEEATMRSMIEREYDRATDVHASNNQQTAMATSIRNWTAVPAGWQVPVLVIHGTRDPVVPFENGIAAADRYPGAHLHVLDGLGHLLPDQVVDEVADAILSHALSAAGG